MTKISLARTSRKYVGERCPKCGKGLVEVKSKRGDIFWGCEEYPSCKFHSNVNFEIAVINYSYEEYDVYDDLY